MVFNNPLSVDPKSTVPVTVVEPLILTVLVTDSISTSNFPVLSVLKVMPQSHHVP